MTRMLLAAASVAMAAMATPFTVAQPCPDKNVMYWQAFPPGGESDLSARHQQLVLKKKCPAIETVIQYKAGAGGALAWGQINTLPGDGVNIVGVNLPHIVLQPLEGNVHYKTDDITPVYWYHYTPDALVVADTSPLKTFADFLKAAKEQPGKLNIGGSGLNSANHAAHERLNQLFGIKTIYVAGSGEPTHFVDVTGSNEAGIESLREHKIYLEGLGREFDPDEFLRNIAGYIGLGAGVDYAVDRSGDGRAASAAARRADVQGARCRLGRRRLPRHRCAEVDSARTAQALVGLVGCAER